jgi:hypothetical protein
MCSSTRRAAAAVAVAVALVITAPSTASAAAFCNFNFTVTISPGLSMTPTAGTFTSGGQTGKITCYGDIYGKEITGPGRAGASGGGDGPTTCTNGSGHGEGTIVLPTSAGEVTYTYPFTFSYVTGAGPFSSDAYSGGFGFLPGKGNCFTEPVTEAHVMGFGYLTA